MAIKHVSGEEGDECWWAYTEKLIFCGESVKGTAIGAMSPDDSGCYMLGIDGVVVKVESRMMLRLAYAIIQNLPEVYRD